MSTDFRPKSSLVPMLCVRARGLSALACAWLLAVFVLACGDGPARVLLVSPANGAFTTASTVEVTGALIDVNLEAVEDVQVNGISVGDLNGQPTFAVTIPLASTGIEQPIVVEVIGNSGTLLRDRVTVLIGDSIADGDFSQEGIALRSMTRVCRRSSRWLRIWSRWMWPRWFLLAPWSKTITAIPTRGSVVSEGSMPW